MYMEQSRQKEYEAICFREQGTNFKQSTDLVRGTLLIYYLRDHPKAGKDEVFAWFGQIGTNLERYHMCKSGQYYRFLNPYSILITEEGNLLLLDLNSPVNENVMKEMQQRSVRRHFLEPVVNMGAGSACEAEIFGFGRTIQFVFANITIVPEMTKREEKRFAKVIEKCTEGKKKYASLSQALSELPEIPQMNPGLVSGMIAEKRKAMKKGKKKPKILILAAVAAILLGIAVFCQIREKRSLAEEQYKKEQQEKVEKGEEEKKKEVKTTPVTEKEEETKPVTNTDQRGRPVENAPDRTEQVSQGEETGQQEGEAGGADEAAIARGGILLETYLMEQTSQGNRKAIQLGKELELKVVRVLAEAYEREGLISEAILAYGRLIDIEDDPEMTEDAGIHKMKLEAGENQYAQAVATGEKAIGKLGESVMISALIEEYRSKQ